MNNERPFVSALQIEQNPKKVEQFCLADFVLKKNEL
jgi:hypothetical protein